MLEPCLLQPCFHVAGMRVADFVKFKYGLYKSCGIECFQGIMLEPCLLQPCLHVAGLTSVILSTSIGCHY